MVKSPADWKWSNFRATAGLGTNESFLTTDWILSCFSGKKKQAQRSYRNFVKAGTNQPSPWDDLKNQIYLGGDEFIEEMQGQIDPDQSLRDIPREQKRSPPKPIEYFKGRCEDRREAMAKAYLSGHFTLEEVGLGFGVSHATVSRAVKQYEDAC